MNYHYNVRTYVFNSGLLFIHITHSLHIKIVPDSGSLIIRHFGTVFFKFVACHIFMQSICEENRLLVRHARYN